MIMILTHPLLAWWQTAPKLDVWTSAHRITARLSYHTWEFISFCPNSISTSVSCGLSCADRNLSKTLKREGIIYIHCVFDIWIVLSNRKFWLILSPIVVVVFLQLGVSEYALEQRRCIFTSAVSAWDIINCCSISSC